MNIIRYMSFEVNRDCPLAQVHAEKCPVGHPERNLFSLSKKPIDDMLIWDFWRWSKTKGFRGIILFHLYNEPALVMPRIKILMGYIKKQDPFQAFQLNSAVIQADPEFDIVKFGDYKNNGPETLDNRLLTNRGDGKPYEEMPRMGFCGRGMYWEIPIDNYGNWCLCCNDWRNEESIGNIHDTDKWEELYKKWKEKSQGLRWSNKVSYNNLPRMCRSCFDLNPTLYRLGGA